MSDRATQQLAVLLRLGGCGLILAALVLNELVLSNLTADGQIDAFPLFLIRIFDVCALAAGIPTAMFAKPIATVGLRQVRKRPALLAIPVGLVLAGGLLIVADIVLGAMADARAAAAPPTSGDYYFPIDDAALGYTYAPNQVHEAKKLKGDTVIYEATYTTDAHGRRASVATNPDDRSTAALFFGGSYTFGEGNDDADTLPSQFAAAAPDYLPVNFGLHGYGPQHMLTILRRDDVAATVPREQAIAVYTFIDAHIDRATGSLHTRWTYDAASYHLRGSELEAFPSMREAMPLRLSMYDLLRTRGFIRYFNINLPFGVSDQRIETVAAICAAARDEFTRKFASEGFYVVVFPSHDRTVDRIKSALEARGITVFDYSGLIPDFAENHSIPGDGHPQPSAFAIVAEQLAIDIAAARSVNNKQSE